MSREQENARRMAANRKRWDEVTSLHDQGGFYRVDAFRAGENILDPIVRAELGDITGKNLLHLQCHFGLDTLSLARMGAMVTGLDFSPRAIASARRLSEETGVPGRFVEAAVFDAPDSIHERFDIVFTSWGALNWIPDIRRWALVAAHFARPGGVFYIIDAHPLLWCLDYDETPENLRPRLVRDYFWHGGGITWSNEPDYAQPDAALDNPDIHEWQHGLGEIVTALTAAGLRLEFLHEHDVLPWKGFPFMEPRDNDFYSLADGIPSLPLSFSIKAVRDMPVSDGKTTK